MNARARILGRLAQAPGLAGVPAAEPDVGAYYASRHQPAAAGTALAQFRAHLEAAHGEVHDTDADGWPALLARLAAAKGVRTLLVGANADATRLEEQPDLPFALESYDRPEETWRERLFNQMDAGLSRAHGAIAATGSLVLWTGLGEPRLVSLVPPIHFVLLDADAIWEDLHGALTADRRLAAGLPTNWVLVSGPSKTADIQQTLAYGAHGPRELVVLICHREGRP